MTAAAIRAALGIIEAKRTTDSAARTTTTMAADTQMVLPGLAANTVYVAMAVFKVTTGAGGIQLQLRVPSLDHPTIYGTSGLGVYNVWGGSFGQGVSGDSTDNKMSLGGTAATITRGTLVSFFGFRTGASGGDATVWWALNSASGSGYVLADSVVRLTPYGVA